MVWACSDLVRKESNCSVGQRSAGVADFRSPISLSTSVNGLE